MRRSTLLLCSAAITTIGFGTAMLAIAPQASGQATPAAPARYDMDVGTATGTGMGTGAINPLAMLTGRGQSDTRKELYLRLGSPTTPSGGVRPQADHFMPATARLGASVPLVTPERQPAEDDRIPGQRDGERPRGRILIFWGCGAHAPAGQPVIIDLARLSAGQIPPGLFSTSVPRDRSVTFGNSRTYGDWPNSRGRTQLSPQSSLVGAHRVAGNYSPEIAFSLTQDFMPALTATGTAQPDQSTQLSWNSVAGATGYYAWTMGMKPDASGNSGDMVWWSSSASQQFGGGLWDWLSPSTVATLIRQRVVMPSTQTNCLVPAEVKQAAPDFMFGNLYAYGPEANFAYPPRPANARTPWSPIWTARVRYRSSTGWMIGMPGMGDNDGAQANSDASTPPPQTRCRRRGGLAGAIGGAIGVPGC